MALDLRPVDVLVVIAVVLAVAVGQGLRLPMGLVLQRSQPLFLRLP